MIKGLIDLIKKYNEYLEEKINESKKYGDIQIILDKIINKEELSIEELDSFSEKTKEILDKLDETDKKRIPFTIFLIKNKKTLDDSQLDLFSKMRKKINISNDEELTKKIDKNNKIIEDLSHDKHFENFDDLIFIFDELAASNIDGFELSSKDKFNIINEIIRTNYKSKPNTEAIVSDANDEELPEERIVRNNNEDDIIELLNKYGYDYDKLDEMDKRYLIDHIDLSKAEIILELLKNNNVVIDLRGSKKYMFCKILVNSTEEIISNVKSTCDKYNMSLHEYIKIQPRILVPNKPRKQKITIRNTGSPSHGLTSGGYGNYRVNIEFLEREGYNVEKIMKNCKDALTFNPYNLQHSLFVLEKEYGISLKSGEAFTAVKTGEAIANVDRFIETYENGLEYVRINNSAIGNAGPKTFYSIIVGEREGNSLFYRENSGKLVKFSIANKSAKEERYLSDRRFIIATTPTEELKEMINPVEFTLKNEKQQKVYDSIANGLLECDKDITKNNYILFLDSHYKVDDFVYNINGTRVSRKKVLRICRNLDSRKFEIGETEIKYALSYNSILTEKDLRNLENFRFAYASMNGGKALNG